MQIIMATWQDYSLDSFKIELLDSDLDEIHILNHYIHGKAVFGHSVIGSDNNYAAFSDGTRVTLTLHKVKHEHDISQIEATEILKDLRMLE